MSKWQAFSVNGMGRKIGKNSEKIGMMCEQWKDSDTQIKWKKMRKYIWIDLVHICIRLNSWNRNRWGNRVRTKKGIDDGEQSFWYNWLLVARVYRPRRSRAAALLLSMETIHGLWMMSVVLAKSRWSAEIVARYGAWSRQRWVLGYDGTRGWNRVGNWT